MHFMTAKPVVVKPPVRVIAHRGVRTDADPARMAPENTLPAFQEAARQNAAVELDVMTTRDGSVRVHHDFKTGRMFKLPKEQKDFKLTSAQELQSAKLNRKGHENTVGKMLGIGGQYKMPPEFETVTIPELGEVLEKLPDTHFYVELKTVAPQFMRKPNNELEEKVVKLIQQKNLYDRVTVIGFSPLSLRKVKELDPKIKTGLNFTLPECIRSNPLLMRGYVNLYAKHFVGADSLHPSYDSTNQALVDLTHQSKMPLITWVNNQTRSEEAILFPHLLDMGVDGIITNAVDLLNQAVEKHTARIKVKE